MIHPTIQPPRKIAKKKHNKVNGKKRIDDHFTMVRIRGWGGIKDEDGADEESDAKDADDVNDGRLSIFVRRDAYQPNKLRTV